MSDPKRRSGSRPRSAERVATASGRQYHIGVAPGEVAPYILLCGDPARAGKVAKRFDSVRYERSNREFVTYTGKYGKLDLTVMGTGIGPDNMEIAVVELSQVVERPTFIRIGSCGALKAEIGIGELVVSTGAVRLENTSTFFVPEGYPAVADYEVLVALLEACAAQGAPSRAGVTASAPGFYGAQSRRVPGFQPRITDLPQRLSEIGVLNLEMEISALFTLASISGARAGAVCAVYANRPRNIFADDKEKELGERRAIEVGLKAFEVLSGIDEKKRRRGARHWHPGL